ncbi:MAG: rod shape-determining protein, partial [Clostridia bacterium]|nr:rod shape-determining protein [Clostridia bacterium]
GGNGVDTALIDFIVEQYGLQIGLNTAEKVKIQVGSLVKKDMLATVVNGRDVNTGKPRSVSVRSCDLYEVVKKYYDEIASLALKVLAKLPPEVSAEIRHEGIYLSGGSSQIFGLEDYYSNEFGMQVHVAENPETCVAFGGGILLGNKKLLQKIKIRMQ